MQCACISSGVDDYVETLMDKIITARKAHKCFECGRVLPIGEKHRFEKTVLEGYFSEFRTCLDCSSVRDYLFCDFFYGQIWEELTERYSDYSDYPWSAIAKLTPAAREKVCAIIEKRWEDDED